MRDACDCSNWRSPLRWGRGLDQVSKGGLCPVSIRSPCMDLWKKGRVPRTPLSIWSHPPTSLVAFYPPSNHPPAKKGRADPGVFILAECVHVVSACSCVRAWKADTMIPGCCPRGFLSYCVSRCLGDGRKLFIGLEWGGEIFFLHHIFVCVYSSRWWWLLIVCLIVSN